MSQTPPPMEQPPAQYMRPHRGVMILVFGILGLLLCVIFGIVAWVMGNSDLRLMEQGQMDPSGEGMTRAGKILGIIGVALTIVGLAIWVLVVVVIGIGAAAGAAGAGGP